MLEEGESLTVWFVFEKDETKGVRERFIRTIHTSHDDLKAYIQALKENNPDRDFEYQEAEFSLEIVDE